MPAGKKPGPSILRPKVYERLRERGLPKARAAAISNAMARKRKRKRRR
jgi:hypothetical protein